jgi:hypothetical protein
MRQTSYSAPFPAWRVAGRHPYGSRGRRRRATVPLWQSALTRLNLKGILFPFKLMASPATARTVHLGAPVPEALGSAKRSWFLVKGRDEQE